eukprot:Skav231669  [mRNA]  locus=scaffold597:100399:102855:+ [translate_table: standard]
MLCSCNTFAVVCLQPGLVEWQNVDGLPLFSREQLDWRLPDRDALAQRSASCCTPEPWTEDSALSFDQVATWVSEGFKKISFPSSPAPVPMTEFALDFYAQPMVCVTSSDSEQEPSAESLAHWSEIYGEAGGSFEKRHMGSGKQSPPQKAKHKCHICGTTGHHATACPQLAQKVLKALTQQCRAEDLSEHLQQHKPLRCFGVNSRPRRSLKKASGRQAGAWKGVSAAEKMKKRTRQAASKKQRRQKENSWLLKPQPCHCGGEWRRASYKESQHRGLGRLFWRCAECRRFSDVMDHSLLPRVRMPLPHIDEAVTLYFQGSQAPTLQTMAEQLGHGGQSQSSLQKIRSALFSAEATCAENRQKKRKLSGILEADATSLRRMRLGQTTTLRYFQVFGVVKRHAREVQLYNLGSTCCSKTKACVNHDKF